MSKLKYAIRFLIVSLIAVSCISKEESEKIRKNQFDNDIKVLTDSTRTIIERIDSTKIEVSKLDTRIKALMDSARVSGMAISVINANQIVYHKAFGYANVDEKLPLQINDIFYGASLSKAVFGYLVAKLVVKGTIDLDKPLQQYLNVPIPEFKSDKQRGFQDLKTDKRYTQITARMCLSHTSGLQNWRRIPRPDDLENKRKLKIYFDPGTQYYYSGEGFMLLQYVIEHITGKDLEQLAKEEVFEPLQMHNTSYVWQDRFDKSYCNGHSNEQKVITKEKREEAQAAGSMETNLIDYSLFIKHISTLVKQRSPITDTMFKLNFPIRTKAQFGPLSLIQSNENDNIQLNYGLGWGILQSPFGFGAFKEGHGDGFQHYTILFPEKEIGVVMLSNSDNAESIFREVLKITIADTYTPWKWENYLPYQVKK
nr:serine hydrolase domain-containing protein [uncultured Mucilaginibacter sp.]